MSLSIPNWKDIIYGSPIAALTAGLLEIFLFHPVDTIAKRLMSHQHRVVGVSVGHTISALRNVIFSGASSGGGRGAGGGGVESISLLRKAIHLYPGSKYAAYYKMSQRVVKFAGQPFVSKYLKSNQETQEMYERLFGGKNAKIMIEASAGSIVGVLEVCLLPFDRMKVLHQVNKEAVQSRSLLKVLIQEGPMCLYAGAVTTALRNCIGTFLLFGGAAFTKECVFGLENYSQSSFTQDVVASAVGASIGVAFVNPMDVIKTRIQNKNFGVKKKGMALLTEMIKAEGISAFFKGVTPKVCTAAPRLAFSYTMSAYFTKKLLALRPAD